YTPGARIAPAWVPLRMCWQVLALSWLEASAKSLRTLGATGATTPPLIEQRVATTAGRAPEEPTLPVMVESVQVTAPRLPDSVLRTANEAVEPRLGGV